MTAPTRSRFVYVTYIRTTPAKLWTALTDQAFIRRYWFGMTITCDWKKGSPWTMTHADGTLTDSGKILEVVPRRRLVIRWLNEWSRAMKAEGPSRCTFTLERVERSVKLTITHEIERPASKLITAVSGGWPLIMANLKSLLETGRIALKSHPGH